MSGPQQPAIEYDVFALSDIAQDKYSTLRDRVHERLAAFDCSRSTHLQNFARSEVHRWEAHGHSRTYVLITPDDEYGIEVAGFFTIGLTSLDFSNASNSARKRLMGSITMEQTGAYSIAELARSDRYSNHQLPGTILVDEAKQVVKRARSYVAGRFLVVDAQQKVFERLYEPAGFRHVSVAEAPRGMEDRDFITACCVIKDW
ncbi:hypothetical protein [Agromyces larvae]|uniref:N-acetyltransferase n=1 Tax=Agromyces larvae TaxID=2929802 RepID=A0ABY4BV52_9MICO|nr:hypothetical protein [Agromyces larvae]UOE43086.1 hypothetical protein MTO99_12915 [Agromyces larvae]